MTPDIEKLAREAGIEVYHDWQSSYESETVKRSVMEHLYALIRAQVLEEAERAVLATQDRSGVNADGQGWLQRASRSDFAAAIRALKQPV
jgi:hypothetical protein